jgi:ferrous iron transport protein A
MATSASSFPAPLSADPTADEAVRPRVLGRAASLASVAPGTDVRVLKVTLEADLAAWVAAVGIREGDGLTVLRRAAFGGPIHVRTRAGGEFALARSLAAAIYVRAP